MNPALNPVAVLMEATREILMYGHWPNWVGLSKVTAISVLACWLGAMFVSRLAARYPKLAT